MIKCREKKYSLINLQWKVVFDVGYETEKVLEWHRVGRVKETVLKRPTKVVNNKKKRNEFDDTHLVNDVKSTGSEMM